MLQKKSSLIIGRQPLVEAIQSGRAIDKILLQKNANGDVVFTIRNLSREHNIPIQVVPVEKLNYLTNSNHQGVIAFAALVQYMDLQQVIDFVVSNGETPLFLMLDGVTDIRNIGGIARSALCCGALEHIQICRVSSLLKAVDTLHLNGIKVFTSEMRAEQKLYELDFKDPCCIIMGDEGRGVQPHLAKAADYFFSIPMAGKFDSFNVSVATGIILYEAMKQRQLSGGL